MNKEQFLEKLAAQLQVLDDKEKQDILDEYTLHIDMKVSEGLSEEEAIRDFGDVKELVADILEAYHVNPAFCTPAKVKKKEWKTPDIGKVKEEGLEACTKAGGFLKRKMKSFGEKCAHAFRRCKAFFRGLWEKLKRPGAKKKELAAAVKKGNERHIIRDLFCGCKTAVVWFVRFCWNLFWFLAAVVCVLMTIAALFGFGVLIIWEMQGYPLTGLTLGSFGILLMCGALTGLALSLRKKKCREKKETAVQKTEVQYE